MRLTPVFHVVSFGRGAGKTSLLEAVIPRLVGAGVEVVAVKHTAHPQIDLSERDTYRLARAGARCVVALSEGGAAILRSGAGLEEALGLCGGGLVLVEGFKAGPGYKLAIVRDESEVARALELRGLVALVLRGLELSEPPSEGVCLLSYDDADGVASFILERAVEHVAARLPGLDCGACAAGTCRSLALMVLQGRASLHECPRLGEWRVRLLVDGREVSLSPYPSRVVESVVRALVGTLKGVPELPERIVVEVSRGRSASSARSPVP
mgnify:CR=1 FL=1